MLTLENVRREKEKTYTNIFTPLEERMRKILDREEIEYEVLGQYEIPDDQPQYYLLDGEREFDVVCIVSHLNREDLTKIADKIPFVPDDEI